MKCPNCGGHTSVYFYNKIISKCIARIKKGDSTWEFGCGYEETDGFMKEFTRLMVESKRCICGDAPCELLESTPEDNILP